MRHSSVVIQKRKVEAKDEKTRIDPSSISNWMIKMRVREACFVVYILSIYIELWIQK